MAKIAKKPLKPVKTDKKTPKKAVASSSLVDLPQAAVDLIKKGKSAGFITQEEVLAIFPKAVWF